MTDQKKSKRRADDQCQNQPVVGAAPPPSGGTERYVYGLGETVEVETGRNTWKRGKVIHTHHVYLVHCDDGDYGNAAGSEYEDFRRCSVPRMRPVTGLDTRGAASPVVPSPEGTPSDPTDARIGALIDDIGALNEDLLLRHGGATDPVEGWPTNHPVVRFKRWLEWLAGSAGDNVAKVGLSHLRCVVHALHTPPEPEEPALPPGYHVNTCGGDLWDWCFVDGDLDAGGKVHDCYDLIFACEPYDSWASAAKACWAHYKAGSPLTKHADSAHDDGRVDAPTGYLWRRTTKLKVTGSGSRFHLVPEGIGEPKRDVLSACAAPPENDRPRMRGRPSWGPATRRCPGNLACDACLAAVAETGTVAVGTR